MSLFNFFKIRKHNDKETTKEVAFNYPKDEITLPERKGKKPIEFVVNPCPYTSYEAFFENGVLFNVNPRNNQVSLDEDRQTAYDARYIISDGIKYDLYSSESILSIKIPAFKSSSYVTRDLSYILKMKANIEQRVDLMAPLAYKAATLMIYSRYEWRREDYYSLVTHLWKKGEIEYGDYLLQELNKRLPFMTNANYSSEQCFNQQTEHAKKFKTDLIEIGYMTSSCPKCAIYQKRIYSISGMDKRFPKLPQHIIDNKGLHCNIPIYPVLVPDTISNYVYDENGNCKTVEMDAIKYSNRPFVDDRCEYEKNSYKKRAERFQSAPKDREQYIQEYKDAEVYHQLKDLLGNEAPKSLSGYRRMKSTNSANYQKLIKIAAENGININ